MIDYIRGTLTVKSPVQVTVEAHGVGYALSVPLSTFEKLPDVNAEVKLLTHHYVREDLQRLYGFMTEPEREIFRRLIGITKIGPKVALGVLSGVSVQDLTASVRTGDAKRLKGVPGIGPKTAERLVMELKGKLGQAGSFGPATAGAAPPGAVPGSERPVGVREEAYEAMVSLGYVDRQVQQALARVEETVEGSEGVEEWIRRALQVI